MRRLVPLLLAGLAALPAAAEPEPIKVLVLELRAQDVPPAWARLATELTAERLSDQGFAVMTKADLAAIAELEGEKAAVGCEENSCLSELAGALGARYVIYGEIGMLKPTYMLSMKLFDAGRAHVEERVVRVFDGAGDLPGLVPALLPKLMRDLAVVEVPVAVTATDTPALGARADDATTEEKTPLRPGLNSGVVGYWHAVANFHSGGVQGGNVEIRARGDQTVRVIWNRAGQSPITGTGLTIGPHLYVAWESRYAGVVVYERQGPKLIGLFSRESARGVGREVGERKGGGPGFLGTWAMSGVHADQISRFQSTLRLSRDPDGVYRATWTGPDGQEVVGFGVERDGFLVLAYHLGAHALGTYTLEDGELRGGWLNYKGERVSETMTRRNF